jgi:glycosyltransferase involved in cell wall biosynthesis
MSSYRNLRPAYVLWDFPALSQTFVMNELRWLVGQGIDVRVYYAIEPDRAAELDFEIEAHKVDGLDQLVELLEAHDRTVMHSFFTYPAATVHAWPAASRTGIPFTFGAHAVDIFHYKNDGRNRIGELGRDPRCLRVFVPGAFHRTYLIERGVPWHKISLSTQAVDLSGLREHAGASRSRGSGGPLRVISVARFIEKKGLSDLVLAGRELADVDVSIDIYGYGPLEDEYRALIERHSIDNVTVHGPLGSRADYVDALSAADLLVAPCVRASNGDMDGIPTVLMEAMTLGVLVAASRASSIPDLVVDGDSGLLMKPGDVSDVARAIRAVAAMDAGQRRAMAERASARVEAMCSVDRAMNTLLDAWGHRSEAPLPAASQTATRTVS